MREDEIVVMFCNPHDAVEFLSGEDPEKIENCICVSSLIPEGEVTLVPKAEFLDWLKGRCVEQMSNCCSDMRGTPS